MTKRKQPELFELELAIKTAHSDCVKAGKEWDGRKSVVSSAYKNDVEFLGQEVVYLDDVLRRMGDAHARAVQKVNARGSVNQYGPAGNFVRAYVLSGAGGKAFCTDKTMRSTSLFQDAVSIAAGKSVLECGKESLHQMLMIFRILTQTD